MKFNVLDFPNILTQPQRIVLSAWYEHVPFAQLLIELLHPKIFVELGTHSGMSYCTFCQAVQRLELDTACYAIDTWEGDPQTHFYGPKVLEDLRQYHDPLYGSFSQLLKCTFDEGLSHFREASIDLLHIDGCHTYDAVKYDFDNWLPKMSQRGVILFHDTNVQEGDFGVWKFWEELKGAYPHFEFLHMNGLGVLGVGEQSGEIMRDFWEASAEETSRIQNLFYHLGRNVSLLARVIDLEKLSDERERAVQVLTKQLVESEQATNSLAGEIAAIKNSKAWEIGLFFRRLRDILVPPKRRRTQVLSLFIKTAAYPFKKIRQNKRIQEDITLINSSGLFDKTWYLANNPDVAKAKVDPAEHYLLIGGLEERNPGPGFNSAWYLHNYIDVKLAGINPLIHYLRFGKEEGRLAQPIDKNQENKFC